MRVNSPGSVSAGAGVAVEAGGAGERNISVNSPGSGAAGGGACVAADGTGAIWSSLGANI